MSLPLTSNTSPDLLATSTSFDPQAVLAEPLYFGLRPVRKVSRHTDLIFSPSASSLLFSDRKRRSTSAPDTALHRAGPSRPLRLPRLSDPAELQLLCAHLTASDRLIDHRSAQARQAATTHRIAAAGHAFRRRWDAEAHAEEHADRIRRKGRVARLDREMRALRIEQHTEGRGPLEDAYAAHKRYEMAEPRTLRGTSRALKWIRSQELGLLDQVQLRDDPLHAVVPQSLSLDEYEFDFDLEGDRLSFLGGPRAHSTPKNAPAKYGALGKVGTGTGTPAPARMLSHSRAIHPQSAFFTGSPLCFSTPSRFRLHTPLAPASVRASPAKVLSPDSQMSACERDDAADDTQSSLVPNEPTSAANHSPPSRQSRSGAEDEDADDEHDTTPDADYDRTFSDVSASASFFG